MLDVFNEQIETIIKMGITNLYWYKNDLYNAWLMAGVPAEICKSIFTKKNELSKRQLMDLLYEKMRDCDRDRRLEISRNFAKCLIDREIFIAQDQKHRIDIAEECSQRLRDIEKRQKQAKKERELELQKIKEEQGENYESRRQKLNEKFLHTCKLEGSERGYALEKNFTELMKISNIPVEKPFKILGEQIDGAIKYDGHYYLVELKWIKKRANQQDIASLYLKVEGKMDCRGLFIAMNSFSRETLASLPKGKNIAVMLLDGVHITNVISGIYTFHQLLEHAIKQASVKGEIFCSHEI